MMRTTLYRAGSRGYADHGWLKSYHTFSFAGYYNPERIHFGALRVLNDDHVEGGSGFGLHPHSNMEIISIPLKGALAHTDSMGNSGVIGENEIQVMSAGKGIQHSEYNASEVEPVEFLQIWVFPNQENVEPRYDQIKINPESRKNRWQQIVSPSAEEKEGTWIYQEAWFYLADLDKNKVLDYTRKGEATGLYLMVLEGEVEIAGQTLQRRDAIGIEDVRQITVKSLENSFLLLMEVSLL